MTGTNRPVVLFYNQRAGRAQGGQSRHDTPEGRRRAADEFLVAVPVTEEISRIIHEMSEQLPPDRREAFVAQMTEQVNMVYMKQLMFDGLVGNLTAAELQGAARFYSSPEGKAVREKLPKVIDEIMPLIQAELSRTTRRLSLPRKQLSRSASSRPRSLGTLTNLGFIFGSSWVFFKVMDAVIGMRVSPEVELEGLDVPEMGAHGYAEVQGPATLAHSMGASALRPPGMATTAPEPSR